MRVRWNPGESRPKSEIDGTYGRGETRRSSGSRRRRGSRRGRGSSPAAVATGTENREREEGGKGVRLGFIGRGVLRGWKGSRADWPLAKRARAACLVGATAAVACRSGACHRRGREGKERGEEGKGMVAADGWGRQRGEGEG